MARILSRNVLFSNNASSSTSICYPFGGIHLKNSRWALHLLTPTFTPNIFNSRHFTLLSARCALSPASTASGGTARKHTIAIRREDVNVWERRAPLSPAHVRQLVRQGFRVLVQPSNRRVFSAKARKHE